MGSCAVQNLQRKSVRGVLSKEEPGQQMHIHRLCKGAEGSNESFGSQASCLRSFLACHAERAAGLCSGRAERGGAGAADPHPRAVQRICGLRADTARL